VSCFASDALYHAASCTGYLKAVYDSQAYVMTGTNPVQHINGRQILIEFFAQHPGENKWLDAGIAFIYVALFR
jgi:hypothetical protein